MTRSIAPAYDIRQKIFWGLFTLLTFIFLTYAFLLNKAIIDVVFVEENQKKITVMRGTLSVLEQKYISEINKVTVDHAYAMGFVDDTSPSYIKTLSLRSKVSLDGAPQ